MATLQGDRRVEAHAPQALSGQGREGGISCEFAAYLLGSSPREPRALYRYPERARAAPYFSAARPVRARPD